MKQKIALALGLCSMVFASAYAQTPEIIQVGINPKLVNLSGIEHTRQQPGVDNYCIWDVNAGSLWVDPTSPTIANDTDGYILVAPWKMEGDEGSQLQAYNVKNGGLPIFAGPMNLIENKDWGFRYEPNLFGGSFVSLNETGHIAVLDTNFVDIGGCGTSYNPHLSAFPNKSNGTSDNSMLYTNDESYDSVGNGFYRNEAIYKRFLSGQKPDSLIFTPHGHINAGETDFIGVWGDTNEVDGSEYDIFHINHTEKQVIGNKSIVLVNYRNGLLVILTSWLTEPLYLGGADNTKNQFNWLNTRAEIDAYGLTRMDGHAPNIIYWDTTSNKIIILYFKNGGISSYETTIDFYEVDLNQYTAKMVKSYHFMGQPSEQGLGNAEVINVPPLATRTRQQALNADVAFSQPAFIPNYLKGNDMVYTPNFGIINGSTGMLVAAGWWHLGSVTYQAWYAHLPFLKRLIPKISCAKEADGSVNLHFPGNLDENAFTGQWIQGENGHWDYGIAVNGVLPVAIPSTWVAAGRSNLLPNTAEEMTFVSQPFVLTTQNKDSMCFLTSVPVAEQLVFELYPNPASTHLTVQAKSIIQNITLVNTLGQLVYAKEMINASQVTIPLENLPKGMYYVSVTTPQGNTTKPLNVGHL